MPVYVNIDKLSVTLGTKCRRCTMGVSLKLYVFYCVHDCSDLVWLHLGSISMQSVFVYNVRGGDVAYKLSFLLLNTQHMLARLFVGLLWDLFSWRKLREESQTELHKVALWASTSIEFHVLPCARAIPSACLYLYSFLSSFCLHTQQEASALLDGTVSVCYPIFLGFKQHLLGVSTSGGWCSAFLCLKENKDILSGA